MKKEIIIIAAIILLLVITVIILAIIIGMVILVIVLNDGVRKIPVQYAKKVQGRKMVGGQTTNIPLRVNTGGVIPVIFASSLMQFPVIITSFFNYKGTGAGAGRRYRCGHQIRRRGTV